MTPIQDYIKNSGYKRSWIYELIQRGDLYSINLSGRTYILNPAEAKQLLLNDEQKNLLLESIKKELDSQILIASKSANRAELINQVQSEAMRWQQLGVKLSGYNLKSVYRKIKNISIAGASALVRKTRSDKFSVRNHILAQCLPKLRSLASVVYMKSATANLSLVVDYVVAHAKQNEEYYELASIPRSTLYKQLSADFKASGMGTIHQYFNHNNLFNKDLPRCIGAFTDDVRFMDYIVGDDHKADVASVYVYDEVTRKVVQKQVRMWYWCEAKTMFPLGWIMKVGELTTADLIESLSKVILQFGLPSKQVLIDNGLGRSDEFKTFIKKLYYYTDDKKIRYAAPYEPTNKATIERSFGLIKNEFDVIQNNFVGPDKEIESRHSTQALSPEECYKYLSDYKKEFDNFMSGFFLERPRTRVIDGIKTEISIKDYFNRFYSNYEPVIVTPQQLRYALSSEDVKIFNHKMVFKNTHYMPVDPLPVAFNGLKFRVLYNPYNADEIDLYAHDDILDRRTGEMVEKGKYVTTLYNVKSDAQKREKVKKYNSKIKKAVHELAQHQMALNELTGVEVNNMVKPDGDILKQREQTEKYYESVLTEKLYSLPVAPVLSVESVESTEIESSLTYEEENETESR